MRPRCSRNRSCPTLTRSLIVALACGLAGQAAAQELELVPAPPSPPDAGVAVPCRLIEDPPLTALSVDPRARNAEGELVPHDDMPGDCWSESGKSMPLVFIDASSPCCPPGCAQLLQLARFAHRPLYFEDVRLERYGVEPYLPGLHAAAWFACDLALLPVHALIQRPRSCVLTPTPHCCDPY